MTAEKKLRVGIDLGGTKTELIALDERGKTLLRWRVATPSECYEAIVNNIAEMVWQAEEFLDKPVSVGVGTPGAISPHSGLMKNANTTCLIGRPLQADLEAVLQRSVRLANDANCFALSEARDGAGEGAAVVFGVIVGTGTGGGVVVHGKVLTGPNAIAGEWGHNPLPWPQDRERPGPDCYCGRQGCIETFLSGPGLAQDHYRRHGVRHSAEVLVKQAEQGDKKALLTLEGYYDRMARALAGVINILDPDVIVLGGGLSNHQALYSQVPEHWGRYVFSDHVATRLVQASHGDSSGVRGAAWLWDGLVGEFPGSSRD